MCGVLFRCVIRLFVLCVWLFVVHVVCCLVLVCVVLIIVNVFVFVFDKQNTRFGCLLLLYVFVLSACVRCVFCCVLTQNQHKHTQQQPQQQLLNNNMFSVV